MLRKAYTQERASVLNQSKKGASLVLAAAKPELKQVELSAYGCMHCGFHFSSNSGAEPFCSNCGSSQTHAMHIQTASVPTTDEDMTSIHCGACDTYNLVESATEKVLAGVAHCVTCGSSLVYDVNDGGADPATTRPPIRESIPTIEHATDDQQNQEPEHEGQEEQASNLPAETKENDGQPDFPVAPPNQRVDGEMESDLEVVRASEDDQQEQQQEDQQQEQASNLAAETKENDGQPDFPVAPPNQRAEDMEADVTTKVVTANRWGDDGFDGEFVDPLEPEQATDQQQQQQAPAAQQQQAPQQQQQQQICCNPGVG